MKIGVCLPYMKPGLDRRALLGWARAIEAGPFDAISCGERVTGPTVSLGAAMAAAAAVTERVRIVPTLYVLPMHDAVASSSIGRLMPHVPRSDDRQPTGRRGWMCRPGSKHHLQQFYEEYAA